MINHTYIYNCKFLWLGLALLAGCAKEKPAEKVTPAKVENGIAEGDLTKLTLTPKAVERLGIKTVKIGERAMNRAREFSGEIVPVSGQSVSVTAPAAATVLLSKSGFLPQAGKKVTKGQELYRLVIMPSERDILSAQAEVEQRQVQLGVAQEKLKRNTRMFQEGSGSQRAQQEAEAELATVRAALRVAQGRVQLLRGNTNSAAANLSALIIKAPISGTIQRVYFAPSQVVSVNVPVIDIVAVDKVWVRVPIYAGDLDQINAQESAFVRPLSGFSSGGNQFVARPVPSPVTADPLTTSVDLFYELPNPEGLFRPGQKIGVSVPVKETETTTVVPYSAIVYDTQGGTWVYENPEPNVFVRNRIEVDYIADNFAVLRRGPANGTVVVTEGVAELFGTEFGGGK